MSDFTLSLKVTRTELTLADLELNDHTSYEVVLWGPGTRARRNTYNTSGNAHGATLNNSVLSMILRPLAIRVLSSSQAQLEARTLTLIQAFDQGGFQLKDSKLGQLTTYACMTCESIAPADPSGQSVTEWDKHQLLAGQHVYRIDVPTQPQPSTGPI